MNIALISEITFKNWKEATYLTIIDLAKRLIKLGNKVVVICNSEKGLLKYEKIEGVPVYRTNPTYNFLKINRLISPSLTIRDLERRLKIKFDIIHNFSAAPVLSLKNLMAKIILKDVKTIHTMKSYSRSVIGKQFYCVLNFNDVVTVPTKIFAERLKNEGVKKSKIKVIRSNIDLKRFVPLNKENIKKKYEYGGEKIVFYYGGIWEEKGLKYLIKAIPFISKKVPNVFFIIAPRKLNVLRKYEHIFKEIEQIKNAKLIKKDINVVEYVNMADVVALPYKNLVATEGNPSCLLEAMACKTPVVTSNLPELREIVEPGKDVLMTRPGDIKEIAEKISIVLSDKSLAKRLTDNAYKKSRNFDVGVIAKEFIKIYRRLVNGS